MRVVKTKYLAVAAIAVILGAGIFLLVFRPDLVSVDSIRAGLTTIISSIPGYQADKPFFGTGGKEGSGDSQTAEKKENYLIELKTGGRVYTDNLKIGDGKLTYETANGLVITINAYEVLGVRKFKEGEEPDR